MFIRLKCVGLAAVLILTSLIFLVQPTKADPGVCSVSSSPELVGADSDVNFQFNFTNTDPSSTIDWITITTPSSSFNIVSSSAAGWNSFTDSTGVEFNDASLGPGDSLIMNVEAQTGPFQAGEIDWGVYAYSDSSPGGPGDNVCQNSTPTDMIDDTPYISNLSLSDITSSTVLISWLTSLPATSQVDYGPNDSYGSSTTLDNTQVTNHAVTVSDLSPNTGYHYQVESTTPSGGDDLSSDNTFLTAIVTSHPSGNGAAESSGLAMTKGKNPPKISLNTTQIPAVTKTIPTIQGTASDSGGIARIEYSTDGGQNWLLVNSTLTPGVKSVNFSFTPANLSDGTYHIEAEAFGSDGNSATTAAVTVVLDRLPPQIGGSIITVGPQILQPNPQGLIEALVGVDQKITVHSIGGPTSVNILSQQIGNAVSSSIFQLTQNPTTGLWSGILSFARAGVYELTVRSTNGAGATTSQYLQTIDSLAPAQVISSKTKDVIKVAKTVLYYRDIDSGSWVVWDGAAYGENNPQTSSDGRVHLLIPPGTYYLKVTARGYHALISRIFTINQSLPLTTSLILRPSLALNLGFMHLSFPSFSVSSLSINTKQSSVKLNPNPLLGRAFPTFTLQSTTGSTKTQQDLYGKPTIIAVMSSWSPTTVEQLSALASLQKNPNINIVPIFVQDSLASVSQYLQTNGYSLSALADPDGTIVKSLQIGYLPTYYFVNQSGYIKKVTVGVLSRNELESGLVGQ